MDKKGKKIKVLMAKTSMDGHWMGVTLVATALRDAGMEVVYGGQLRPEEIVAAAVQEDADVIGLNVGGSTRTVQRLMDLLSEKKVEALVVAGGTVPPCDIPVLKKMGISNVFPPGSSLDSIVNHIKDMVQK